MKTKSIFATLLAVALFFSCKEEIDTSSRYVYTHHTVTSYLEAHEQYSEYVKMLQRNLVSRISETTLAQLLSARGNYTVFAPTNDALQFFLDSLFARGMLSEPTWDGFTNEHVRDSFEQMIVYNSIIDGGDNTIYYTNDFPIRQDAELPISNMYDRKLTVHRSDGGRNVDSLLVCNAPIDERNRDILVLNGIIHAMNRVVAPSNNTMGHLIYSTIKEKRRGFYVSSLLVEAIGLRDSLEKYMDYAYEEKFLQGEITKAIMPIYVEGSTKIPEPGFCTPEHRYYGYTFFAETDSLWSVLLGKDALDITVDDVMQYLDAQNIYPDAQRNKDYTNENNLLNRFVTYHLLPVRLSTDHLVMHYNEKGYNPSSQNLSVAMVEYYVTMGKRRLLKLFESKESDGVYINRFPHLDNGRHGTYHETGCDADKEGILVGPTDVEGENSMRNGMLYPIDKLLIYDDPTRENLMKERIRWDVTTMFNEFTNNDIRMSPIMDTPHQNVNIPTRAEYPYIDGVDISEETQFFYWPGTGRGWKNYHGDEMTIRGLQDIIFRLPPVPKRGTYEIRYASQNTGKMRGIVQFYWGKDKQKLAPMGIPMDLRIGPTEIKTATATYPSGIGWEADTNDDDYNAEVDKRLRNNGFMKGAEIHLAGAPNSATTARASETCCRRVIIRQTMDPDEVYYVRFKTVMDDPTRYLFMDYLEYCAKEVYDNPVTPEDIW